MLRYHKKVYMPDTDKIKLKGYTDTLNGLNWHYTRHSIDNLKYRALDMPDVLNWIKGYVLKENEIFEYYAENGNIFKVCYRIKYKNGIDLILVINSNKTIITIYVNNSDDKHYTLKKELYNNV
jgi:hypothetical protein